MSIELLSLLLLPLFGALVLFFAKGAFSRNIAIGFSLVQLVITLCMLCNFDSTATVDSALQYEINYPWMQGINSTIHFGVDGMSMLMVLLTNILVPLILISSIKSTQHYTHTFYALALLMQFGLIGVFTALDGLLFYIFWEVTLIPIWLICGIWGQENKRFQFTTKFFVYTFVGSLFMLGAFIFVYSHAASFSLTDMYNANLTEKQQIIVFWFIFFAFAVKLPVFPFHTWQPDTYTYAPAQGTMLLSGIMLKMAVFGVLRWLLPITPMAIVGISGFIVLILAIVGVLHGALIALIQNDIKRILAYSSFSHVGLMVAGIFASAMVTLNGTFTIEGGQGAMVQAFAHGFNVVGLFICAEILERKFGTRDIRNMGGLARVAPIFAVVFLIVLLGSLGVPLTNGFIGEFILLKSVFGYDTLAAIIAGVSIILAAGYLLRMYGKTMFTEGNTEQLDGMKDVSTSEFIVLGSIAALVLVFGVYPQPIIDMVTPSLSFIYNALAH